MEPIEKAFEDFTTKFSAAHKDAMDAARKINEIAIKAQGDFARQQMAVLETMVDAGSRQVKLVTETRDPAEYVAKNAEIVVGLNEKLVAAAQDGFELQTKVRDEVAGLIEENVKRAANGAAEVTKTATKPASRKAA